MHWVVRQARGVAPGFPVCQRSTAAMQAPARAGEGVGWNCWSRAEQCLVLLLQGQPHEAVRSITSTELVSGSGIDCVVTSGFARRNIPKTAHEVQAEAVINIFSAPRIKQPISVHNRSICADLTAGSCCLPTGRAINQLACAFVVHGNFQAATCKPRVRVVPPNSCSGHAGPQAECRCELQPCFRLRRQSCHVPPRHQSLLWSQHPL